MQHAFQAQDDQTSRRKHVKSGCRTCKIRKIKCDENRPVCTRCRTTGRTCDGYGIWGGGGNYYGQRQIRPLMKQTTESPPRSLSPRTTITTAEEKSSLDWFICRASKKIPGIFTLGLWDFLVIPASLSDSAVLHALLSVSYAHYSGTLKVEQDTKDTQGQTESEQHLLRHYVKATRALTCGTTGKANVRGTLISCLLFAYLECLRGHFRTAQAHVFGGLRVVQQGRCKKPVLNENNHCLCPVQPEGVDDWIAQAFSRLYVQVCLLKPRHVELIVMLTPNRASLFADINEAWQGLEAILCNITALEQEAYCRGDKTPIDPCHRQRQVCLAEDLSWWQRTVDKSPIHDQNDPRKVIATLVLSSYHAMATIMIETCLSSDPMQYDKLTDAFLRILKCSIRSWTSRSPRRLPGNQLNMPRSIVDIGWIPPLYYTAINCRIHGIRSHAIRLLDSTSHREGFWDVRIATAVARTIVQIEEGSQHEPPGTEDLSLDQLPDAEACRTVEIPAEQRVSSLEVILPDSPEEDTVISFKHERRHKECVVSFDTLLSNALTG